MKVRMVFPGLLSGQSPTYFSVVWDELTNAWPVYRSFFIDEDRQGRMEDADGLPYSLDYLILEELDLIQALLKAPPVRAELQQQLQNAGPSAKSAGWLVEIMKLASSYAQITMEEEGLWDVDVNIFLAEETSVTANYTPRTCSGDLVIKVGEWLKELAAEAMLSYMNTFFAESSTS